jgi:hypothetical protein
VCIKLAQPANCFRLANSPKHGHPNSPHALYHFAVYICISFLFTPRMIISRSGLFGHSYIHFYHLPRPQTTFSPLQLPNIPDIFLILQHILKIHSSPRWRKPESLGDQSMYALPTLPMLLSTTCSFASSAPRARTRGLCRVSRQQLSTSNTYQHTYTVPLPTISIQTQESSSRSLRHRSSRLSN